jgi:hypothetical protein
MTMTVQQRHSPRRTQPRPPSVVDSFASVYVHWSASAEAAPAAVAQLPTPDGVINVRVDDRSMSQTFGCRIAIDLTGTFDEKIDGPSIARSYAVRLAAVLGVPAFALFDLLRNDPAKFR